MSAPKNIWWYIAEWWDQRHTRELPAIPDTGPSHRRYWLPSPGSAMFTLVVVGGLIWAQSAGAIHLLAPAAAPATSSGTVAYQGRLADPDGTPLTGTYPMIFRLYELATGGTPLWEEQWTGPNSVAVSDGLFNVMLGSLNAIPTAVVSGNTNLFLGITVGSDDEMAPRVQLGSVPWAIQALTVPDGSVTTAKLADGAATAAKRSVATYYASSYDQVDVAGVAPQELLSFQIDSAPAGDVVLVADLHARSLVESPTAGTLRMYANGVSVCSEPTHWLPTDMTQIGMHGRVAGFAGGRLTVTIAVYLDSAEARMQFGWSTDSRFGRRLTIVAGL